MDVSYDDLTEGDKLQAGFNDLTDLVCGIKENLRDLEKLLNHRIRDTKVPISSSYKLTVLKLAQLSIEARKEVDDWIYLKHEEDINTRRLEKAEHNLNWHKKKIGILPR